MLLLLQLLLLLKLAGGGIGLNDSSSLLRVGPARRGSLPA